MDYTEQENKENDYPRRVGRFFKSFDYILMVVLFAVAIGLAFIIGIYALGELSKTTWVLMVIGGLYVIIYLVIGWFRNREAVNFYGDRRMRYRRTGTPEDFAMLRFCYIFLIAGAASLICSIIFLFTI